MFMFTLESGQVVFIGTVAEDGDQEDMGKCIFVTVDCGTTGVEFRGLN